MAFIYLHLIFVFLVDIFVSIIERIGLLSQKAGSPPRPQTTKLTHQRERRAEASRLW